MAKDLVRTRRHVKKFIMMKANIQAVSLRVSILLQLINLAIGIYFFISKNYICTT